jgi:cytochrome c553
MKKLFFVAIAIVLAFGYMQISVAQDTPAATKDGKTVFTEAKCITCHAVAAEKIETTSKKKNPDLSGVGANHDAAFFTKYLNKEEKLNDKAHPMKFKGEAADLEILATWLASLKTPAPAPTE